MSLGPVITSVPSPTSATAVPSHLSMPSLFLQRLDPSLPLPSYQTPGACAFDLAAREVTVIEPGAIGLVPTNVIARVPDGCALLVLPRSSLPRKKGLVCPHSLGLIDQDYHGPMDEIFVQVQNITSIPVTVERGERIAQGLLVRIERCEIVEVSSHDKADSRGGFGSTG